MGNVNLSPSEMATFALAASRQLHPASDGSTKAGAGGAPVASSTLSQLVLEGYLSPPPSYIPLRDPNSTDAQGGGGDLLQAPSGEPGATTTSPAPKVGVGAYASASVLGAADASKATVEHDA